MQAAMIFESGAADVFRLTDAADPTPGPGDVLIDVRASSVNPIDWKIRKGTQKAFIRYKLPWVLGLDVAGEVTAVGEGVSRFAVGDAVMASVNYKRPGCYAEKVVVAESELAKKPASISFAEAASLPLAGLTAWQSLVVTGRVQTGQRVLVLAGSGGVGTLAIQIAKAHGAHVVTTCSPRNFDLVRSLGADEVIDYHSERPGEVLEGIDLVLDGVGGATRTDAIKSVRRGGRYVSIVSDIPTMVQQHGAVAGPLMAMARLASFAMSARLGRGVRFHQVLQRPNGGQLAELSELVECGKVRPVIDREFALADIAEAHRYSETGRARGKIAITV